MFRHGLFLAMGVGGDILKAVAKEATRDITKEFDEALIERVEERKRNEAALAAKKMFQYCHNDKKYVFRYTTSSKDIQEKLGVK